MRAVVLERTGEIARDGEPLAPRDLPVPEPGAGAGEVRIRVHVCAVCRIRFGDFRGAFVLEVDTAIE